MALLSALWLGLLTSISPCPLATNLAAVSFLTKKIAHPRQVFWSGLAYTLGRVSAYAVLGALIASSLTGVPTVANFLQRYMNRLLGPVLIVVGLFLLGVVRFRMNRFRVSLEQQSQLARAGLPGSFVLGVLFALSFCPISAALFFGSLIPLMLKHRLGFSLPIAYGFGTGLPILILTIGISWGTCLVTGWLNKVAKLEIYMRFVTGGIFVAVGFYYLWAYWLVTP